MWYLVKGWCFFEDYVGLFYVCYLWDDVGVFFGVGVLIGYDGVVYKV